MANDLFGYLFCVVMTVVLFGIIWGLSRVLSIFTDRMLPEPDEGWNSKD